MTAARLRLGIDFGTSTTIAMLQRPDARVQPLLFDGSPLLSSAVLLGPDGQLHTGRDAAHLARSAPERLEPNPKRRIDDTMVLLGDGEVAVRDCIAAVLGRVAREAARVAGPVTDVSLTHPAGWGHNRKALLVDSARRAGFGNVELVGEPTAAATYFAHTRGGNLPLGACVLVYDLGAGTCDVTLLRRTPTGFEQVASEGLNDVGGLDVDAAVIGFLQATYGELWTSPAQRRQLWDDVRSAKEMLSRASGTVVMVPALGREVPLGREQLESLTRPVLRPTISMTRALVDESGVGTAAIAGLFLVGGSSRIPLVATMLHEALGVAPVVAEQPELVVAEGSLHVNRMPTATATTAMPTAPVSGPIGMPVSAVPTSVPPSTGAPYPVSAPAAYSAAPVSPAVHSAPPMRPMPPGFVPPGHQPPPMAPPPKRGMAPGLVAGLIAVALVAVVGAVLGATFLLKDKTDPAGNPTAASGTKPATAGAANGQTDGPGKYDLAKLPEDECAKADMSRFNDMYDQEVGAPSPNRNPSAAVNMISCSITRMHNVNTDVRTGTLMFTAMVYKDLSVAVAGQTYDVESAKLAGPNSAVQGLGAEAIVYETPQTGADAKTKLQITVAARDSNARLTVYYIGSVSDPAGYSQKDKNDVRDKLVESAKAAWAKTFAGVAR